MTRKKSNSQIAPAAAKTASLKSVQFRTWLYFLAMAVSILAVLWVMQIIFFKAYYHSMKRYEVERVGDELMDSYRKSVDPVGFAQQVQNVAFNKGVNIIMFTVEVYAEGDRVVVRDGSFRTVYQSQQTGTPPTAMEPDDCSELIEQDFYKKAVSSDRFSYSADNGMGKFFVYGAVAEKAGAKIYLHMSSPLAPMEATTKVLSNQLFIVTIICLFLSVLLSWFISSRISRPITEFSRVARQLAKGDYSVRFVGNGYSEIEDLAQTLNFATAEIGKTEELRRDFLANVSHDLRTPLTMVKAYAEMIRDISGGNDKKRTEHSQVIIDEADRLTSLVNDILNLSKLQSGTDAPEITRFDMAALTRSVTERFDIMRERDGYSFELSLDKGCDVYADSAKIEQVMYNLIGNAINYTGEDKRVVIAVKSIEGCVYVGVTDTGRGISPEDIEAVWDKYYRANQTKRKAVGTGLGLSIVKSILLSHSARFGVESQIGSGSTFWFELSKENSSISKKS